MNFHVYPMSIFTLFVILTHLWPAHIYLPNNVHYVFACVEGQHLGNSEPHLPRSFCHWTKIVKMNWIFFWLYFLPISQGIMRWSRWKTKQVYLGAWYLRVCVMWCGLFECKGTVATWRSQVVVVVVLDMKVKMTRTKDKERKRLHSFFKRTVM